MTAHDSSDFRRLEDVMTNALGAVTTNGVSRTDDAVEWILSTSPLKDGLLRAALRLLYAMDVGDPVMDPIGVIEMDQLRSLT